MKMDIRKGYDRNFGKWFASDVLRAVSGYGLIEQGEKVCVALSGGRDSVALLYILWYLNAYSNLRFDLSAVHIKTDRYDTSLLADYCADLGVHYIEEGLDLKEETPDKSICSVCSRLRRGAISRILEKEGTRKIAYGHHADDVAETFFMNIVHNRRLGSFSPRVEYADNPMIVIRPMIYLDAKRIERIHRYAGLPVLSYECPYVKDNLRQEFRKAMPGLDELFHTTGFSRILVDALENIDKTNVWEDLRVG